ncbi:MAG TPA: hypothetical protein VMI75_13695, partial [Polyangiaceae bacterium]|nr:hypothetical protein [Polyangiaceae bacterium]
MPTVNALHEVKLVGYRLRSGDGRGDDDVDGDPGPRVMRAKRKGDRPAPSRDRGARTGEKVF